jgi:hypothetical protein
MAKRPAENKNTYLYVGGGLLLTWLAYKFFTKDESGGTSDSGIKVDESKLTYDPITYKVLADGIEAAIWGTGAIASWTEDDEAIGEMLKEMQNIDDVKALIDAYGRRYVGVFLQDGGNLAATISEYLDTDIKNEVNAVYMARSINFQW